MFCLPFFKSPAANKFFLYRNSVWAELYLLAGNLRHGCPRSYEVQFTGDCRHWWRICDTKLAHFTKKNLAQRVGRRADEGFFAVWQLAFVNVAKVVNVDFPPETGSSFQNKHAGLPDKKIIISTSVSKSKKTVTKKNQKIIVIRPKLRKHPMR